MAVDSVLLDTISTVRQWMSQRSRVTMLSAGYPDILLGRVPIEHILDVDWIDEIPSRPDSAAIAQWHGLSDRLHEVLDSAALFDRLGIQLSVIDAIPHRGGEILADLNYPIDTTTLAQHDIVLDTGTPEHVFHVGQALLNLASLVAKDGYIIQALPLNSFNHGFYNINPTLIADLYSPEHGFRLLRLQGYHSLLTKPTAFPVEPHNRFRAAPENSVLMILAKREAIVSLKPFTQRKYRS